MRVLAIDISSHAVEIMAKQGVKEVQCVNVSEFHQGQFDTVLMMMHGIGLVEDLAGLDRFLHHAHQLLKRDGQILCDSPDGRYATDPNYLAHMDANRRAGRYFGEIRTCFEYRGKMGRFFGWLHVDPETLIAHAERIGWSCQMVLKENGGDYLAQMTPVE